MPNTVLPFSLGQASTSGVYANLLGQEFVDCTSANGPRTFVVVKLAAALAAPARKVVVSAISGGFATFVVNTTTTAGVGPGYVIPAEYTSTIPIDSYILAQVKGPAEVLSAAAVAAFALVGTSTTAGKADDATITGAAIGYATEAAAGADENMGVMLR